MSVYRDACIKSSFQLVVNFSIIIDNTREVHHLSQEFYFSFFDQFSDICRSDLCSGAFK